MPPLRSPLPTAATCPAHSPTRGAPRTCTRPRGLCRPPALPGHLPSKPLSSQGAAAGGEAVNAVPCPSCPGDSVDGPAAPSAARAGTRTQPACQPRAHPRTRIKQKQSSWRYAPTHGGCDGAEKPCSLRAIYPCRPRSLAALLLGVCSGAGKVISVPCLVSASRGCLRAALLSPAPSPA